MNESEAYHSQPTAEQIDTINDLIDDLDSAQLDWLLYGLDGWRDSTLDFWLTNYGRARDFIVTLEEMINGLLTVPSGRGCPFRFLGFPRECHHGYAHAGASG